MSANDVEQRVIDMWKAMTVEACKSMGVERLEGDELSVMHACANVALRQQKAIHEALALLDQHWCQECGNGGPCSATNAEHVLRESVDRVGK